MNNSPAAQGVVTNHHVHPLKITNYKDKADPGYSGGWICNLCSVRFGRDVDNLYCSQCNFDICQPCFDNRQSSNARSSSLDNSIDEEGLFG